MVKWKINFFRNKKKQFFSPFIICIVLLLTLIVRCFFTSLPSHRVDMGGYNYWSHYLADRGFQGIYQTHLVYGPAYLYLLWISGEVASFLKVSDLTHEFLIKFWAVLADFIGGFLIYLIGKQQKKQKLGFCLGVAYILNPAVFINSSVWGQFDSLLAIILFGVVYCFVLKKDILAITLYTIAILTKPQSILLFPLVFYLFIFSDLKGKKGIFFNKQYWLKLVKGGLGVVFTYIILVLPVFSPPFSERTGSIFQWIVDLFLWLPRLYFKYVNDYPYATANAFNLWTILGGQVTLDKEPFLWLTYGAWSKILLFAFWGYILWILTKVKKEGFSLYYISYLLAFGFFMFTTRLHERYLVPALIFLIVSVLKDFSLWFPAVILSICVMINQAYMYELAKSDVYWLAKTDILAWFIAIISLIIFIYSLYYVHKNLLPKRRT